jgi:hypothetical protein
MNKKAWNEKVGVLKDFTDDIVCSRGENGPETNVPRRIIWHSPDGFEWGYGGSGPSDFALNILSIFIDQDLAERYYQDFKWAFIAPMRREGGVIHQQDIWKWIKAHIPEWRPE